MNNDFQNWASNCQARIEAFLEARLPASDCVPERLHKAMRYSVLGGGKRVRPLLSFAAGELAVADVERVTIVAAAVELIHAYSLVHDDLPCMDDDILRRGKPTCHVEFDEATALLTGDSLQTLAFELLAEKRIADAAETQLEMIAQLALASGSRGMAGGQAFDLDSVGKMLSLPELEFMHIHKTGALIRAAVMLGAKLVFPGPDLSAEGLLTLFESEQVTLTCGVPTIWLAVLDQLEKDAGRWKLAPGLRIVVAGSACPESIFRRFDRLGIHVIHLWGMTETTPVATVCHLHPSMTGWSDDEKYAQRAKQGVPLPFVETRVVGDGGETAWDAQSLGELQVRGPWVAGSYFNYPESADRWTDDGWFHTGDVVSIDSHGYVKIADRTKDLIKSGGEWISSVDLENALVGHPAVKEAAVIAVAHPKWVERPLALVVLKDGATPSPDELRDFLAQRFAKWQLPEAIVFVDELPHTSTGKLQKLTMREKYKDWKWE